MHGWGEAVGEQVPRVGIGFDTHPWAEEDRPLWLGGVRFDGERGLAGHSDGDVVSHAIADAALGAAAQGDVGMHFPDDDPAHAGISGAELLAGTIAIVGGAGFRVRSCDTTVICVRPAISTRSQEMRSSLAQTLGIPVDAVSVKATRPEGLGLTGDGIGCLAVVVLT
jgi:2-C-methyl-D-erythritol 2,4-cyclodiphosphate synthase